MFTIREIIDMLELVYADSKANLEKELLTATLKGESQKATVLAGKLEGMRMAIHDVKSNLMNREDD